MKKVQSRSQRGMMSCSNISTSQHNYPTHHQDHNKSQNTDSEKNSGSQHSSKNQGQFVQPLKKEFFLSVLDLEEKLFGSEKKQASASVIDALVGKYAQCIEYFDAISNPITVYFLEKIQITLSTSRLLSLLVTSEQLHGNMSNQEQTQQEYQEQQRADKLNTQSNEKMLQSLGNLHKQQSNNIQDNIIDSKPSGIENKITHIQQQQHQQQQPQPPQYHSTTPVKLQPKHQENTSINYFSNNTEEPSILKGIHRKQQQSLDLLSEMSIISSYDRPDELHQRQLSQTNYLMQFDEKCFIDNSNFIDQFDNPDISKYNEKQKKAERAKRVDLYLRVRQAHHSPQNTDFSKLLNNFQNVAESNDRIIRNDLKQQFEAIEMRLAIKRNTHIAKQRDCKLAILNQMNNRTSEKNNVDDIKDHGTKGGFDEEGNEVVGDYEDGISYDNQNTDSQSNKININNLNQNNINQDNIPIILN